MSLLSRLVANPKRLSGVYRQSSEYLNFSKIFTCQQQLIVNHSSKPRDPGKSDKSGSQSSGSGSDKKRGEGGSGGDPYEQWCCAFCPPPEDNPNTPTMYDVRKYGHCLPQNNVNMYFEPIPPIPTGVFRNTDNEVLGLGAGKNCMYKNPEYFSFHHMTYYDMHLNMRCYRKPSPKTGRKP